MPECRVRLHSEDLELCILPSSCHGYRATRLPLPVTRCHVGCPGHTSVPAPLETLWANTSPHPPRVQHPLSSLLSEVCLPLPLLQSEKHTHTHTLISSLEQSASEITWNLFSERLLMPSISVNCRGIHPGEASLCLALPAGHCARHIITHSLRIHCPDSGSFRGRLYPVQDLGRRDRTLPAGIGFLNSCSMNE